MLRPHISGPWLAPSLLIGLLLTGWPRPASADFADLTYKNTSGQPASDFKLTTTGGMTFTNANVYEYTGKNKRGGKINKTPPAGTFPATTVDLTFATTNIPDNQKADIRYYFPKGMKPNIDKTMTGFTNATGGLIQSESLTMAPQINDLGGGHYEVVLTNVNAAPVDVTSLAIMYNDPGDTNQPDYVPGGTLLSITQPTNPIGVNQSIDYFFQADPYLAMSVSDLVATTSAPTDQYFDLFAAQGVPEPSGIVLLVVGVLGALGYRAAAGRRRGPSMAG